jgi:hypothetical protein
LNTHKNGVLAEISTINNILEAASNYNNGSFSTLLKTMTFSTLLKTIAIVKSLKDNGILNTLKDNCHCKSSMGV